MSRKAVFLDKDGTLVEDVPYNVDPEQIRLTVGALEAVRSLHLTDYQLFIITNQSGVARGYFPETALITVEQHLRELFQSVGVPLAGFYYCPHHPDGSVTHYATHCNCRKPQPGLLLRAASQHQIDLNQSWFIGDILHDIQAGRQAGCRTILLDNGNETEWQLSPQRLPHHTVNNLIEAANVIQAIATPPQTDTQLQNNSVSPVPKTPETPPMRSASSPPHPNPFGGGLGEALVPQQGVWGVASQCSDHQE
ncbi:MAG: HAD-IIIA family hydrolase [Leptolyngbyaceae cyanobacterium RM2_2_4]|nr:HAD-IIIA family hydrolase [Leptolyngbyaceae cyanobacterium RM2_2_4]